MKIDPAAAHPHHAAHRALGHPVGAGEVGVDHLGEVVLAHQREQLVPGDPGVGDQHLDRAVRRLDLRERRVDGGGVGDVARAPPAARSTGSPDREVTVTASPRGGQPRAMARPMPRFPPVTRTDRLIGLPLGEVRRGSIVAERTAGGLSRRSRYARRDRACRAQSSGARARSPETGSTLSSPRYRSASWPTPRCSGPASCGAEHADFRAERIRGQQIRLSRRAPGDAARRRRPRPRGPGRGRRHLGLRGRRRPDPGRGGRGPPREAVEVARVAGRAQPRAIELAPEPAHGEVTLGLGLRGRPVRRPRSPTRSACWPSWSAGLLAADGIDHVDASLLQVKECKFYADGADHRHPAAGPAAPAA